MSVAAGVVGRVHTSDEMNIKIRGRARSIFLIMRVLPFQMIDEFDGINYIPHLFTIMCDCDQAIIILLTSEEMVHII
jgi:hypothetical protein